MQTTLVVNPTGGLGARIVEVTPVTQTVTADVDEVALQWSTTAATTLRWSVGW